jgi:uncharacterized membrane protein
MIPILLLPSAMAPLSVSMLRKRAAMIPVCFRRFAQWIWETSAKITVLG